MKWQEGAKSAGQPGGVAPTSTEAGCPHDPDLVPFGEETTNGSKHESKMPLEAKVKRRRPKLRENQLLLKGRKIRINRICHVHLQPPISSDNSGTIL